MSNMTVNRALISVYDKSGVVEFAGGLHELGIELVSSGGTAQTLSGAGIPVTDVSEITDFPSMLDGRVKTLHPAIHASILADRNNPAHMDELAEYGWAPIDLVVVNLYPFEQGLEENRTEAELVELIDIGGPTMVRAAAKNYESVGVLVDTSDYDEVLEELAHSKGRLTRERRRSLAADAFSRVASLDATIHEYLRSSMEDSEAFPSRWIPAYERIRMLRYGENPHQKAALYRSASTPDGPSLATARVHQGKQLSYNNMVDLNSCLQMVQDFEDPAAVVIKHNNPCGAAEGPDLLSAYERAHACDPMSAYGSIVGVNRRLDSETARAIISEGFVECVLAPAFSEGALEILEGKAKLRVVEVPFAPADAPEAATKPASFRQIAGGILRQDADEIGVGLAETQVRSERQPTDQEWKALRFAWRVCKNVISNSIVLAKDTATVGIGAGQMSRVDSVKIACRKAGERSRESVLASDAFFPFRDAIDAAAEAGVTAVIQPGGSIRDEDVIEAVDEHDMAMVFTGTRHFRH